MKLVILTTETLHHSWYVRELKVRYPDVQAIVETTSVTPPFATAHEYERRRDDFEQEFFFEGQCSQVKDVCAAHFVENVNDSKALSILHNINPDIVITFGTRKIGMDMIANYENRIINLHGGDPELYRGLDSHLWAIYHNDFDSLVTTLHMLNETLDDGEMIQKLTLNVQGVKGLWQLRSINTKACVDLTIEALKSYEHQGRFVTQKQRTKGRYYSFMPTDLKEICVRKFQRYVTEI